MSIKGLEQAIANLDSGNAITVTGVAAGTADIIVMTSDGNFVAVCKVTVTAA
ncbi:Ig-like domain-containing protein [Enterobacter ludwigii]|uniref:Ig-like domain-containing protein n=1 Tax=Enterobacter ludwigii TaxID=299767 RepID=UPI002FF5D157